MRKIRYIGKDNFKIINTNDLEPGPDDVVIDMKVASLCGSDLHIKERNEDLIQNNPDFCAFSPGHEPAGIVRSTGSLVTSFKPGDRVAVYHKIGCGKCRYCDAGEIVHCPSGGAMSTEYEGACADQIMVPQRNCFLLPPEISFEDGAIMMCAGGTVYSALKKARLQPGETMVIFGCGPIGLTTLMFAKAMGAKTICTDINPYRLELAENLGADLVLDGSKGTMEDEVYDLIHGLRVSGHSLVREVMDFTRGMGVECAVETTAAELPRVQAVDVLKKHGRLVYIGINNQFRYGKGFQRSGEPDKVIFKELEVFGSNVFPLQLFYEMVDFMKNDELTLKPLITHRFLLEEGTEAFKTAAMGESGKVIIHWP
jgi:propanol-preferring alcohol dehydrogenase